MNKPLEELNHYDIGCSVHTAMRKLCDSPSTSAAYNLVHVLDDRAWTTFCRLVLYALHQGLTFPERLGADGRRLVEAMTWYGGRELRVGRSWKEMKNVLPSAAVPPFEDSTHEVAFESLIHVMLLFDDSDWENALFYLSEDLQGAQ